MKPFLNNIKSYPIAKVATLIYWSEIMKIRRKQKPSHVPCNQFLSHIIFSVPILLYLNHLPASLMFTKKLIKKAFYNENIKHFERFVHQALVRCVLISKSSKIM